MSQVALITAPAVEPLALAEAKAHMRIENDRDDAAIQSLIGAARELCERFTRRALIEQRRALRLERLPSLFKIHRMVPLPYPPLIAVEQVTARSASGADTILPPADYEAVVVYQEKRREAEAAIAAFEAAAGEPVDPARFPLLAAELGLAGLGLRALAELVLAKAREWTAAAAAIEATRLTAKRDINAAASADDIEAIVNGLVWGA